jgi:hypothetical protein
MVNPPAGQDFVWAMAVSVIENFSLCLATMDAFDWGLQLSLTDSHVNYLASWHPWQVAKTLPCCQ